jgi:hypothetical protein
VTDTDFTLTAGVLGVEGVGSVGGAEDDDAGGDGGVEDTVGAVVTLSLAEGEGELLAEALADGDGLAEADGPAGPSVAVPGTALVVARL